MAADRHGPRVEAADERDRGLRTGVLGELLRDLDLETARTCQRLHRLDAPNVRARDHAGQLEAPEPIDEALGLPSPSMRQRSLMVGPAPPVPVSRLAVADEGDRRGDDRLDHGTDQLAIVRVRQELEGVRQADPSHLVDLVVGEERSPSGVIVQ